MGLKIRELKKRDINKAIQFAIVGMHFDWYTDSKTGLALYGRYFWYLETNRATQIIAVYDGDTLAGVLLAELKGERSCYRSYWKAVYVKVFDFLQRKLFPGGAGVYDETNRLMFRKYAQTHEPDGEIIFLAANPDVKIKGIGSMLLGELERRERGKEVYLYTDNACTYQFYEHRGFERVGGKDIVLEFGKKKVPLTCLLYAKVLG